MFLARPSIVCLPEWPPRPLSGTPISGLRILAEVFRPNSFGKDTWLLLHNQIFLSELLEIKRSQYMCMLYIYIYIIYIYIYIYTLGLCDS